MERIQYIDRLKGFCILMVCFCHFPLIPKGSIIGNIGMAAIYAACPCFMMVTGGLTIVRGGIAFDWKKYFLKFLKTYLVMVVWRMAYYFVYLLFADFEFSFKDFILQTILLVDETSKVNMGIMWYMKSYLIMMIFYPLIYHLYTFKQKRLLLLLIVVTFIDAILLRSVDYLLNVIMNWDISISGLRSVLPNTQRAYMLLYFLIGIPAFEYREEICRWVGSKKWVGIGITVIGLLGQVTVKQIVYGTWRWDGIYIDDGYMRLFTFVITIGLYITFMTCNAHFFDKILGFYGKHTMGIYYIHWLLLYILWTCFVTDDTWRYYSFGLNVIKTISIVTICAIITSVFKKNKLIKYLIS